MHIVFISLFDEWCLGLRYLSASLIENEHRTSICYLRSLSEMNDEAAINDKTGFHLPPGSVTGKDFQILIQKLKELKPDLIGLSVYSNFFKLACHLTEKLKKDFPETPIVWGGVDCTANPDLAIKHTDIVCLGEGEQAIVNIANNLDNPKKLSQLPNLWFKNAETVYKNEVKPLEKDLDKIPYPDFSLENKYYISSGKCQANTLPKDSHLHSNYPVISARGCPNHCSYCCNSLYQNLYGKRGYVRQRSVESIISEIELARKNNPNIQFIEFHDDVFGINLKWLDHFADSYSKRIGLPFFCYTYITVCNPKYIELLKKAGVGFVTMGIQSGSMRTLREIYLRKGNRDEILEAVQMLLNSGITTIIDLIGDNPMETEEDQRATLELLMDLPKGYILHDINTLAFYRNYPLTELAEKSGISLNWLEGRNVACGELTLSNRFWKALHMLAHFQLINRETILQYAENPLFREKPELIEAMSSALIKSVYMPSSRIPVKKILEDTQNELVLIKSSRLYKIMKKIRKYLLRTR